MLLNYIRIAIRNFRSQKSYTILNIVGLSLGIAASLLIMQYVKYEKSFDRFHSRADDIYRIQYNGWQNGVLNFESAVSVPASSSALKNNFAEVEAHTRFLPFQSLYTYEKPGSEPISFREERGMFADTSLFKVFDFRLLRGNPNTCLKGLNKIMLSETTARKYFGDEDPLGKKLIANGEEIREVTGVFEDVPENSHIKFDVLVSYETLNAQTENESETSWGWYDFYCFVLLKPGTDANELQAKWDEFLARDRKEAWEKRSEKQEFILRPLTSIHLNSNLLYETSPQDLRDGDSVYALSIIAFFILIIAWVNYINLATARSFKRANEVGVRKVVGALRSQLVSQFLTESFLLNIIAVILGLLMVRIFWSSFSQLTGWNIPVSFIQQPEFWFLVFGLFVMGALFSGFYPAVILSSFKPVSVLKGKVIRSSGGNLLRKALVAFQFVASVVLISGTLIVYQQLNYMKNKDLGINIDKTVVLKSPQIRDSLYVQKAEGFKTEVLRIPGVKSISASSNIPGFENYWTNGIRRLNGGTGGAMVVTHMSMDYEHVPQYKMQILEGRNFDRQFPNDGRKILINETLSRDMGFKVPKDAVGEIAIDGRDTVEIIGVLGNYHQMSLKAKVIPVVFRLRTAGSFYSLKLETDNYRKVMADIEAPWNQFFPENPIDYFFLDQYYNRQYDRDDRFSKVFTLFTFMAIFIASLGLLGLASFMTVQRTKEIGIRKVLGSSANNIVLLLSRGFVQLVLIANIIAWPSAWLAMDSWLQAFPYRIEINFLLFPLAGAIVLVVAFVSVSVQTLKAARVNPAKTLKYE